VSDEAQYKAMLEGLFSLPPPVIAYEDIPAHLAGVRAFEEELAERMACAAVQARREARIAACDPSSGRIALGQDPLNWRQ
jgi:hypothetical protein